MADDAVFSERYKKRLLEVFRRAIGFLEEHHVKWLAAGGTCLGAVRHHGIIPWDDDVDIFVLRDDYERLFTLRGQMEPYGLEMESIEDGGGYYNGFIKIFDRQTTLWERKEFEHIIGIYIDVFPLERSDISLEEYLEARSLYREKMRQYLNGICKTSAADLWHLVRGAHCRTFYDQLKNLLTRHDKRREYEEFVQSTRQIAYNPNGSHLMVPTGSYAERDYWPAEWFTEIIDMPFADFTVKVPAGYDGQMRLLYGDYMQYPPKEKQVSHHFHYYCNFKERLSLDEVKERMRGGESIVY